MRLALATLGLLATGTIPPSPPPVVTGIEYQLVFNKTTAATRSLGVSMRFQASSTGPVELSLPAWTPGSYEISNYARRVSSFSAAQATTALRWDKTDFDTWRVQVSAPGPVTVAFSFTADTLDNAMAWSRADFAFVNGTNVLLYPEGAGFDFPATLSVETETGDCILVAEVFGCVAVRSGFTKSVKFFWPITMSAAALFAVGTLL